MQGNTMNINFHVMHMTREDVVLVHEWLHNLGSLLHCRYQSNTLAFEYNGVYVYVLAKNNEVNQGYFCYFLSWFEDNSELALLLKEQDFHPHYLFIILNSFFWLIIMK